MTLPRPITLLFITALALASRAAFAEEFKFRVFLDDKEIGKQTLQVTRQDDDTRVDIDAQFDVKLLFVKVFSYQHKAEEVWQGQCLKKLTSKSRENKDKFFVDAERQDKSFVVESQDGRNVIEECVRSYAYWDLERINTDKLLNSQTGEYQPSQFSDKGETELDVLGDKVALQHYAVSTEESTIHIYYDAAGNWVALQTLVDGDRNLAYYRTPLLLNAKPDS